MPFDELLEEVDRIAKSKRFNHQFICQTGTSKYQPSHCEHFRFLPSIDDQIEQADMVITHGGSTVLKLLKLHKPFIAVANPRGADDHQGELLEVLGQEAGVLWTRDVADLEKLVDRALNQYDVDFDPPNLVDDLIGYIDSN